MTTTIRRTALRQPGRPLKSPLAVPSGNPASRKRLAVVDVVALGERLAPAGPPSQ